MRHTHSIVIDVFFMSPAIS